MRLFVYLHLPFFTVHNYGTGSSWWRHTATQNFKNKGIYSLVQSKIAQISAPYDVFIDSLARPVGDFRTTLPQNRYNGFRGPSKGCVLMQTYPVVLWRVIPFFFFLPENYVQRPGYL